jgi:hypothetical protein
MRESRNLGMAPRVWVLLIVIFPVMVLAEDHQVFRDCTD